MTMSVDMIASLVLGASVVFLSYTYVGYPFGMRLLAQKRKKQADKAALALAPALRATAILSARDGGARLAEKLAELLALPESDGLARILVGIDGPPFPDSAGAPFDDARVHLVAFSEARGKAAVLADLIPLADTPILVFLDVRQTIPPGTIAKLLAAFADPAVAVASGELVFSSPTTADAATADSYWSFEKRLRQAESAVASVPGATGALYAIRRAATVPPPPGTLNDDVLIPMRAVLAGGRCLFVPGAACYDVPEANLASELRRKRRTAAGNWQLLRLEPRLLSPRQNPIFLQFLSHKIFRVCTPFACLLIYVALLPLSLPLFALASAALLLSLLAALARLRFRHPALNLLAAPFLVNYTLLMAALRTAAWR